MPSGCRSCPGSPRPPTCWTCRAIARRIAVLVVERTREHNRLHALRATAEASTVVGNDIEVNLRHLERRIELLTAQAVALIGDHSELHDAFERLLSVPGIATHTAVQLLPELLVLPAAMTVRQWVAHAGLDPRAHQSGTSVDRPARISKVGNAHIRRALYMPALVAVQHNRHVRAFFEKLVARGKTPLQAYVAVMRKLLHAIYGMFATRTNFVAAKFHAAA
jgi:transposase